MKQILMVLVFLLLSIIVLSQIDSAIVCIKAYQPNDSFFMGTGSIVKYHNKLLILTCYHLIANATHLKASCDNGDLSGIKLFAYDDKRDLSLLDFDKRFNIRTFLELGDVTTNLSSYQCKVFGYPLNWQLQSFMVELSSNNLSKNSSLNGIDGKSIFQFGSQFDIIPLINPASYGGCSGAPLIVGNRVIGIFAGSVNDGGALGWAIPVKYLENIKILPIPTSNFSQLIRYNALKPRYNFLLKSYKALNESIDDPDKEIYQNIKTSFLSCDTTFQNIEQTSSLSMEYYGILKSKIDSLIELTEEGYTVKYVDQKLTETAELASAVTKLKNEAIINFDSVLDKEVIQLISNRINRVTKSYYEKYLNKIQSHIGVRDSLLNKMFESDDKMENIIREGKPLLDIYLQLSMDWKNDPSYSKFKLMIRAYKNFYQSMKLYNDQCVSHSLIVIEYMATLNIMLDFLFESELYE